MGLKDITDEVEEETKEEEVEDVSDKLGIDDKEDLENLDDRIIRLYNLIESMDKRIEQIEKDIRINRGAIAAILQYMDNPEDDIVEEAAEKDVSIEDEEESSDSVDFKPKNEQEEETNPWMRGDN